MSIPDNPFDTTPSPTGPTLQINTAPATPPQGGDITQDTISPQSRTPSPHSNDPSPHSANASPRATPGGPHGALAPPGGTGHKTPRRVQWTSDSHIVQLHPIQPAPSSPQTLDSTNIEQFRDALEQHRRDSIRRTGRPPSSFSQASSADGSETRQGTDEDYDYRLDVDPPRPEVGERRGSDGSTLTEDVFDNGMRDHVPTYIAPGERDGLPNIPQQADVDQNDTARELVRAHTGKWGVLRRRVRGAGAVKGALSARAPQGDAEKQESTGHSSQDAFAARYPEPRRPSVAGFSNAQGGAAAPGGASVLSSLLALYGQQPDGSMSGNTSAASSRPTSEDEYSSDEETGKRKSDSGRKSHRHSWMGIGKKSSSSDPPSNTTPGEVIVHDEHHPAHVAAQEAAAAAAALEGGELSLRPSKSASGAYERQASSPGMGGFFQRAKEQIQYKRPESAKSGAGVFGALIQNTQNITGVATPTGSSLAPAAKRPGYQLSRYSLPDVNDTQSQAKPAVWRPPSRPSSRAGSRAGSRPPSVHSSTAVSRDEESPKDDSFINIRKKTVSSDDIVGMRNQDDTHGSAKKKRPKSALHLDSLASLPAQAFNQGTKGIKNAEKWLLSAAKTPMGTPPEKGGADYFSRPLTEDERRRKEWEAEKKRRKKAREARKKQEIFIIQHVAAILARQQFLMKLARALMMFGSPSHRLETQIQATAKVLEINCQVVYLPGTMLLSFGDDATHTSETKFLKQATGLDLGKLLATHALYWNVVHDKMSVDQASKDLDVLMTTPVYYTWWQTLIIGAACSAFITVISFYGSFIDALMAMPLGATLVGVQMLAARNDMFGNVFEIAIATLISFVSAALASTKVFCYTALVSGGVVLILPGYIVLCGALELASRNITAGAVRIGYSVIYSLFLGFGISIGAVLYEKITHQEVQNSANYQCDLTHNDAKWYMATPSAYWYFLCCPGYSLFLSLRNQQPLFAKELPVMVLISCAGWTSNHFSSLAFPGRSDMTSAIGSFVVGTLGSLYGRLSNGSSFPVTVTGIMFQLPSGLSNGGIFNFAAESSDGSSTAYSDGFSVAEQLVSVAIGLTVGLFVSAAVMHPFGGGRRRGSGIFSF
ncbi:hypothetical protein CI109_102885 [Kwoniella shandongensis]|uniref:Uncharacterized protein n=1 Tax=Kwoniella shandongensis TaxID=1734106 RepID=A0A5M6CCR6_9TREE|nr:uncharacterized protein CI109_000075 [Kwoniella shandongensis]KAA5531235.1 hypothetical protein CI109_000075 [Kwoniella shandongensis]